MSDSFLRAENYHVAKSKEGESRFVSVSEPFSRFDAYNVVIARLDRAIQ
jgi:hypothetical protein